MKIDLMILLVICLSCWLTPADSTKILGSKIAAGVKGALALKGKMLKGVKTLLAAKGSAMPIGGNVNADEEQEAPETVEQPTYFTYEQDMPYMHPVAGIRVHPIHFRIVEDRPKKIQSVRLVPLNLFPMGIRTIHAKPEEPSKPASILPNPKTILEFKKKIMLGLFNKISGVVANKKKAIAGLMKH